MRQPVWDREPPQWVQPHGGPYHPSTSLTCSYRGYPAAGMPRPWPPRALRAVSSGFRLSPALVLVSPRKGNALLLPRADKRDG